MERRGALPQVVQNGHKEIPVFRAPTPEKPRKQFPILDSLREIQSTQRTFIVRGRGMDDPPQSVVGRMFTETQELSEAVETGDRAEIASELADVFLLMTRVAHTFNIPLEIAISDKIARNQAKYNPWEMEQLREAGLEPDEVESVLKGRWDRDRDKEEFSRLKSVRAELAGMVSLNGHNGHNTT